MKKVSNIILGLSISILGILIGLNILEVLNFTSFFAGWWTLFIIIPSLFYVISSKNKAISIIFFIIGILLFLACNMIIDFSIIWSLLVPIIILGIGFSFLFNYFKEDNSRKNKKNEIGIVFDKQKIKTSKAYDGGSVNTIFGYLEYDLEKSKISKDIMIDITSLFGVTTIYLPSNVNVIVKSYTIFGTFKNSRETNKKSNDNTVFISSKSVFGGVNIR
jgi:predicted membrane protein